MSHGTKILPDWYDPRDYDFAEPVVLRIGGKEVTLEFQVYDPPEVIPSYKEGVPDNLLLFSARHRQADLSGLSAPVVQSDLDECPNQLLWAIGVAVLTAFPRKDGKTFPKDF